MAGNMYDMNFFGILSKKIDYFISLYLPGQKLKGGIFGLKNERSRMDSVLGILEIAPGKKSAIKDSMMEETKIGSQDFERYFDFLLRENFIEVSNDREFYNLTRSGERLLKGLSEVYEILD
ncbi:MAG: winged helix-turn-helix domain-containing protein [Bacteroidota bacterium]